MKISLFVERGFLLVLIPSSILCQSARNDSSSFVFPLAKGDMWFYNVSNEAYPGMHFSYNTTLKIEIDTLMPNGKTYFPYPSMESGNSWHDKQFLRKEGPRVFQFSPLDSNEYLRFDFSAKKGDTIGAFTRDLFHGRPLDHPWYIILSDTPLFAFRGMSLKAFAFAGSLPLTEINSCVIADTLGIVLQGDGYLSTWRLIGAKLNGKDYGTILFADREAKSEPNDYYLYQNFPNPFNPTTKFYFSLGKSGFTTLNIYNLLGEKVVSLINEQLASGYHEAVWDANKCSSGVYFFRLQSGDFVQSKKLVLLK